MLVSTSAAEGGSDHMAVGGMRGLLVIAAGHMVCTPWAWRCEVWVRAWAWALWGRVMGQEELCKGVGHRLAAGQDPERAEGPGAAGWSWPGERCGGRVHWGADLATSWTATSRG